MIFLLKSPIQMISRLTIMVSWDYLERVTLRMINKTLNINVKARLIGPGFF